MADPWADFIPAAQPTSAPAATANADPWADFVAAKPSTLTDIAKSAGVGLSKGAIGTVTAPRDIPDAISHGLTYAAAWAAEKAGLLPKGKTADDLMGSMQKLDLPQDKWAGPTAGDVQKKIEGYTGDFYKPQTTAGKYVEKAAEFIPGGMATSPTKLLRGATVFGALPGAASEAAGQLTEGTAAEPYARMIAPVVAGGVGGALTHTGQAGTAITRASQGMTPAHLDAMEALMRDAQAMGLPLSRAEAAQAVTNGATRLADLQRVVEGSGQMRGFYAERPAQVEAVGRQAMDTIAPVPQNPSMVGPAVGEAATGTVQDVQGAINRVTRPLYQRAEQASVGQPVAQALAGDPLYAQTLQAIRRDPSLNRTIANLPDDSPGVIDLVQRRLRENADNAAIPGQASSSNLAAANFQDARTAPIAAAETATGSRPGVMGDYEAARALQTQLREQYLAPLTNGPIGKLAQKDIPTQNAIDALFPKNPIPNSEREVQTAVQALVARNPWAARQLVRAHTEQTFNQATKDLQSGGNQFGGANFAAAIRGHAQESANFVAALSALPGGQQIVAGFDRMLDVMAATGQRQRAGSMTSFNNEIQSTLKNGGVLTQGSAIAAGAGITLPRRIMDRIQQWNLGKNTEEIARLLTDPDAAGAFRALAEAPAGSAKAGAALARLTALADRGREKQQ